MIFQFLKLVSHITLFVSIFACTHQIQQTANQNINSQQDFKQQSQNVINPKSACLLSEKRQKPLWIDHPPQNDNYLYGIGIAPKQIPVTNQIQSAKILAMREISQQIKIFVKSQYEETVKAVGNKVSTTIESHTKITSESLLHRVKIIDQWNDVEYCNIYALAAVELTPFFR